MSVPFIGLSRKEFDRSDLMRKAMGVLAERLSKSDVILVRHKRGEKEVVENKGNSKIAGGEGGF